MLSECLVRTGACLAGSFMLQLFHDEIYEDSDIDVFCPNTRVGTMLEFFVNTNGRVNKVYGANIPDEYKRLGAKIEVVIDIYWMCHKVQLISVYSDNVSKYIHDSFDLSFCKLRWDGKQLLPYDRDDIAAKRGIYNPVREIKRERFEKYRERGYKIRLDFDAVKSEASSSCSFCCESHDCDDSEC